MAKKSSDGKFMSDSAYIETGKDDTPEQKNPYFSYDEVLANHGSDQGADMTGSVNSRSGEGIMGHGVKGEPEYPPKGKK